MVSKQTYGLLWQMYANVRAISKPVLTARTGTVQLSYHTLSKFDVLAKKDKNVGNSCRKGHLLQLMRVKDYKTFYMKQKYRQDTYQAESPVWHGLATDLDSHSWLRYGMLNCPFRTCLRS